MSMITTRGFDLESFAYEMDSMAVRILEGTVAKEDMFCDIFCLDEGDDPFAEENWIKACPILATTERGWSRYAPRRPRPRPWAAKSFGTSSPSV